MNDTAIQADPEQTGQHTEASLFAVHLQSLTLKETEKEIRVYTNARLRLKTERQEFAAKTAEWTNIDTLRNLAAAAIVRSEIKRIRKEVYGVQSANFEPPVVKAGVLRTHDTQPAPPPRVEIQGFGEIDVPDAIELPPPSNELLDLPRVEGPIAIPPVLDSDKEVDPNYVMVVDERDLIIDDEEVEEVTPVIVPPPPSQPTCPADMPPHYELSVDGSAGTVILNDIDLQCFMQEMDERTVHCIEMLMPGDVLIADTWSLRRLRQAETPPSMNYPPPHHNSVRSLPPPRDSGYNLHRVSEEKIPVHDDQPRVRKTLRKRR